MSNKLFWILGLTLLLVSPVLAQGNLQVLPNSVLADNTDEQVLTDWLSDYGVASGTLLYRKSNDGNSGTVFHQRVDNQGPTLVLIKLTNGTVFGGYNPNSWLSNNTYSTSSTAFVFNLTTDNRGLINPSYVGNATYNRSNQGPTFGGGHDIYLDNSMSNGYVRGWSYNAVDGSGFRSANSVRALTGLDVTTTGSWSINGLVEEVEVYKIEYDVSTPNIVGQDITVFLDENGQASITAEDIDNGSSDADGPVTLSIDITDFTCDDLGGSSNAIEPTFVTNRSQNTYSLGGGYNPNAEEYWFPQWSGSTIYRVSKEGTVLGNFNSGQSQMMQLWTDPDSDQDYFTANWGYSTITKRNGSSTIWSYNLGITASGVTADSEHVYAIPSNGGYIAVLDKENGQRVGTINLEGNPNMYTRGALVLSNGIFYVGAYAYSGTTLNNNWRALHLYDIEGNYLESRTVNIDTHGGFAFDGENLQILNYSQIYTYKISDGLAYGAGNNAVTLTVTDPFGNTASEQFGVSVEDQILPTITLNGDAQVSVDSDTEFLDPGATTADNCSAEVVITGELDLSTPGTYTLTYTALDQSGNESAESVTREVTVIDATAPEAKAGRVVVELDENGQATVDPASLNDGSTDNGNGTLTFSLDRTTFDCNDLNAEGGAGTSTAVGPTYIGTQSVNTHSHGAGYNPSTGEYWFPQWGSSTINVYDENRQFVRSFNGGNESLMMDLWMDADSDTDYYTANWGSQTITKRSGSTVIWSYNLGTTASSVTTDADYVYAHGESRNYIVRLDKSTGQYVDQINLPGVIYTRGGMVVANGYIYIAGSANGWSGVTSDWRYLHQVDLSDGSYVGSTSLNGQYPWNMAFDGEVMWFSPNSTIQYGIKIADGSTYGAGGGVPVTLTVTDELNNSSTAEGTVAVVDLLAPTVELNGDATMEIVRGIAFDDPGATASDNCSATVEVTGTVDINTDGEYTLTYKAVDGSGNESASVTRTVIVGLDETPPTVITKDIIVALDENGNASIVPEDVNDGSTDNEGITGFSFSAIGDNGGQRTVQVNSATRSGRSLTGITYTYNGETKTITPQNSIPSQLVLSTLTAGSGDANRFWDHTASTITESRALGVLGDFDLGTAFQDCADPSGVKHDVMFDSPIIPGAGPEVFIIHGGLGQSIQILDTDGNVALTIASTAGSSNVVVGGSQYATRFNGFFLRNNVNFSAQLQGTHGDSQDRILALDINPDEVAEIGGIRFGGGGCNYTYEIIGFQPETLNQIDFSCANLGANTVTLTAVDEAGNEASANATVTIVDNINPELVGVPADVTVEYDAVPAPANVTATDNCANPSVSFVEERTDGISNNDYTLTRTWTATDAGNNSVSGTQVIRVVDTTPPTVITRDVSVVLDANGNASITADDVDNGSSDASGPVSLSIDQSTFDCDGLGGADFALAFDGTDYVQVSQSGQLDVSTMTVEAWIKPNANDGNNRSFISMRSSVGNTGTRWSAHLSRTGGTIGIWNGSSYRTVSKGSAFNAGQWYHVALVMNTSGADLFIDGSYIGRITSGINTSVTGNDLVIGDPNGSSTGYSNENWIGEIDEVRIWNGARTSQEIQNNKDNTLNGNEADLIAYFDLNEGEGTTAGDGATSGLSGSLINMDPNSDWVESEAGSASSGSGGLVTLTVTDASGNFATGTATVTVVDNIAPSLTLNGDSRVLHDAYTPYTDLGATVEDNCSATLAITDDINVNVPGTYTVTLTATDGSDNATEAFRTVIVRDITSPTINTQSTTAFIDAAGVASISTGDLVISTADDSGQVTTSLSNSGFACEDLGDQTVIVAAEDVNGNSLAIPENGLIGYWKFGGANPLVDLTGNWGDIELMNGASINNGALDVNPGNFARTSGYNGTENITSKTLISYVSIQNLNVRSGSAISIDGVSNDNFDAIVYAERQTFRWMNGSSNFRRTQDLNPGFAETEANQLVQMAITYEVINGQVNITAYRNGIQIGAYTDPDDTFWTPNNVEILFGTRHSSGNNPIGGLDARIEKALLYNRALSANEIAAMNGVPVSVSVVDEINPTLTGQPIEVVLTASGTVSIIPEQVTTNSGDNCGPVTLSLSQDTFGAQEAINSPVTVQLTATDPSGNATTVDVLVTVIDPVPVVVTKNIIVELDANGNAIIQPTDVDNGSSSIVGIGGYALDINSFDCSNVGNPVTVTLTVTSTLGSSASGTAEVTVFDVTEPVFATRESFILLLDENGQASVTPDQYNRETILEACGIDRVEFDRTDFSCTDVGFHVVNVTVFDIHGNSATTQMDVEVRDEIAPTVITRDITVQLDATGNATITPAMINDGSYDNCEIASITLDQTTFDCADVEGSGSNDFALNFDGNDNVTIQDAQGLRITDDITVEAWFKMDANPGDWVRVVGKGQAGPRNYGLWYHPNGVFLFQQYGGGGQIAVSRPVQQGRWYHIAGTRSGGVTKLYIDGQLVNTATASTNPPATSADPLTIGYAGYHTYHRGQIDEVRLWNVVRTDQQILDNYNIGLNGDEAGLVAYYNMEEGQGTTLGDVAENGHNGVLSGFTQNAVWTNASDSLEGASGGAGNGVTLTVTDVNGNVSTGTATVIVEDNVKPTVITQDITVQLDASGNASITAADINHGSTDACGIASTTIDISSFDCSDINKVNTVTLTVTDNNGNVETGTAIVTVKDNVKPTVTTRDITVQLDASGNASIIAADINDGSTDACGIASTTIDISSFDCSDINEVNTVTLTVTDNNGNVETGTAIVTVEDKVKPTVVTQNITVQLDASGNASITAADINDGSSDACGIASTTIDISSFDCSDINEVNTVTLTVTDNNGNVETGTAIVTVEDNVKPTVITQNITIQLDETGNVSITAADINNGSNDACGIASTTIDVSSFTCVDVFETNVVTLTVTDNNGNVDTGTAIVTVEDNTAPLVVTQSITVALDASGVFTIQPSDVDGGTTDACGFTLSLDNNAFNCGTLGENTVMLTATDPSGNSSTAPAIVTVIDNAAPTIVTNPITVQLDKNGQVSIVASQVDGGTYDNCAVASVTIDISNFDCEDLGDNTVTITATDVNGNVSTAPVNVEVIDIIPPTLAANDITVTLDENGNASITPEEVVIYNEDDVVRDTECDLDATKDWAMKLGGDDDGDDDDDDYARSKGGSDFNMHKSKGKGKGDDNKGGDDDDDDDDEEAGGKYLFDTNGGTLLKRLDGSLLVTGTLVNSRDANDSWAISMELTGGQSWEEWDALGRKKRGNRREIRYQYQHWSYHVVSGGTLTGQGANVGQTFGLAHAPGNIKHGFQLGTWANNETSAEGLRGSFKATMGDKSIDGELNLEVSNCSLVPVPEGQVYTGDNCSIVDFSFDQSSFTCADLAETTVNLTATDQSGNATTVPVTVTVIDDIAPTAIAQDIEVNLGADGTITIDPSLLDGGSYDNTNCLTFTLDRDTFSCSDVTEERHSKGKGKGHKYDDDDDDNDPGKGKAYGHKKGRGTKVMLTVTDAAGNTDQAEAYVVVRDNMGPTIGTEPVTVVVYGRKRAYLSKYDVALAVTDNCKVKSIDFPRTRYDRSDAGMNTVMVTATDDHGNATTGLINVDVVDITNLGKRVEICYKGKTRTVSPSKVQSYLRKGAQLGACGTGLAMSTGGMNLDDAIEGEVSPEPLIELGAFPNPAESETKIRFSSDVSGPATVAVMSTAGVRLTTLYDGEITANQNVEVTYNTSTLSSGVYVVRMMTAGKITTLKLLVRK